MKSIKKHRLYESQRAAAAWCQLSHSCPGFCLSTEPGRSIWQRTKQSQGTRLERTKQSQTFYRVMGGISSNTLTAATMLFHECSSKLRSYIQKTIFHPCLVGHIDAVYPSVGIGKYTVEEVPLKTYKHLQTIAYRQVLSWKSWKQHLCQ